MASNKAGKVTQVLGAVVDVAFEGELPPILKRNLNPFNRHMIK